MRLLQWLRALPPFLLAGGSLVGLAWLSFLLALFGLFSSWLIGFLVIVFFSLLAASVLLLIWGGEWWRLGLLIALSLLSILIGATSEPTVFSGRDQGSIAEATWRLAENGDLTFSMPVSRAFFDIYGPGTALNFPGFAYTEGGSLITQFPLAYTAWLASFVSLFGLFGYTIGNLVLLCFFGWGMFELLSLFVSRSFALGGTVLALFSFLPVWIAKYTLTENLAVVLFVFLAFTLIRLFKEKTTFWYGAILILAPLLAFTRIEGFVVALVVLCIIFFSRPLRSFVLASPGKHLLLPSLILLFIFLRDFFINLPFYKMIGKAIVKKWAVLSVYGGIPAEGGTMSLGTVFLSYGLLILFLVALLAFFWLLRKRNFSPFPVLLLAAPTLIYFFLPSITLDHPWMLRRYYFSLFPTAIFLVTLGLAELSDRARQLPHGRALVILSFACLLLFQGNGFVRALAVTENRSLLAQTERFAERFNERDLILIDRGASGDPFSMLTGPMNYLFGKQAVYFFNPTDLALLDLSPFDRVYLLLPEDRFNQSFDILGEKLLPLETVSFVTERFEESTNQPFVPPTTVTTVAHSVLFQITP